MFWLQDVDLRLHFVDQDVLGDLEHNFEVMLLELGNNGLCFHHDCRLSIDKLRN